MAVAVSPADCSGALSEEAPGVGLAVRVPAVAVVSQASAGILLHIIRKLSPLQTGRARVSLRHGAIVVAQLSKALRTREWDCKGEKEKHAAVAHHINTEHHVLLSVCKLRHTY